MLAVWFISITFRRSKGSMAITMQLYWIHFNNILKKKYPHLVKKKVLFHQDNAWDHMCPTRWSNSTNFATNCFPSIFARFSSLRLFPVSKPEEMIRRKEIHHQRAAHRQNRCLFWRVGQIILFGRLEKIGENGSSVSSRKETMLRNKNESIKKNVFYYIFLKILTCLRIIL